MTVIHAWNVHVRVWGDFVAISATSHLAGEVFAASPVRGRAPPFGISFEVVACYATTHAACCGSCIATSCGRRQEWAGKLRVLAMWRGCYSGFA